MSRPYNLHSSSVIILVQAKPYSVVQWKQIRRRLILPPPSHGPDQRLPRRAPPRHPHPTPLPHAAARTSLLSRRWTRVWAGLPVLDFEGSYKEPHDFMDSVDAALAAFSAPAVRRLQIAVPNSDVPAATRVAPWLRFASQRLVGTLYLHVRYPWSWAAAAGRPVQEIELPVCDAASRITLDLSLRWRLQIQPAPSFAALSDLEIKGATMEARVLEDLVSSQCPNLRNMILKLSLVASSNVSIRSKSLSSLTYHVSKTSRIEVVARKLEVLSVRSADEARISAPKLAEVHVFGGPRPYKFVKAPRHLQLLDVRNISASLVQHFDKVEKLKLGVFIQGIKEYKSFVAATKKLPVSDILHVSWQCLKPRCHGFVPSMLHILRRCNGTRRLTVNYYCYGTSASPSMICSCPASCPCRLPESCNTDDITLNLLEEVEINFVEGSPDEVELFVKQLSKCNAPVLKKVAINYRARHDTLITKELCAKVRSMCRQDLNVEFNMT
ncbi:hypothetical protein EJB05_11894, partial [Eragrostis curvula]